MSSHLEHSAKLRMTHYEALINQQVGIDTEVSFSLPVSQKIEQGIKL